MTAGPGATIAYIGHADHSGYGRAAVAMVAALGRAGLGVRLVPTRWGAPPTAGSADDDRILAGASAHLLHTLPEHFPAWIGRIRARTARHTPIWGYTTWESDRLPSHWPALLDQLDGVLVPSHWNARVFAQARLRVPVRVLPHAPPMTVPPRQPPPDWLEAVEERFLFHTIGDWNARKAPWLVIRAFLAEFDAADPVALVVKTGRLDRTRQERSWRQGFRRRFATTRRAFQREMARAAAPPPVLLVDHDLDASAIAALHHRGQCYVSLSHGEGWGLGAFEAALAGRPVIATGHGGWLDFLPADLAGLVRCRQVPVAPGPGEDSYEPGQSWAEADQDHARALMRQMAAAPLTARTRGAALAGHVAALVGDECLVRTIREILGT